MLKTSEWVSTGHPDKMADFISSYLLDRYLEKDPMTRYAVEVQIKGLWVTLGGEVTSKANFTGEDIAAFVRAAVNQIGYTSVYQKRWGKENTICGDDIVVTPHISLQSADIAQGVNNDGWGDQASTGAWRSIRRRLISCRMTGGWREKSASIFTTTALPDWISKRKSRWTMTKLMKWLLPFR